MNLQNQKTKIEKEVYRNDLFTSSSEQFTALACLALTDSYPDTLFEATDRNGDSMYIICCFTPKPLPEKHYRIYRNDIQAYAGFYSQLKKLSIPTIR